MENRRFRTPFLVSLVGVAVCLAPAAASAPGQPPELIHDTMTYGAHPDFEWHANLVGWFTYLDGYLSGLPDLGWRSAVISDVRFDARVDTTMLIVRIDRNEESRFVVGYTPVPHWENWFSYNFITLGVMIGADGSIRPVWAIDDPQYGPGTLGPGIYDLRLTVDRSSGIFRVEADMAGAFDAPLSLFSPPVWSASWSRDLEEILYIQICPYNQFSAVYDVWSTPPTPGLLRISSMPAVTVEKGDTVVVRTKAEYDGEGPLVWSIGDARFSRIDTAFVRATGPGDCGLHHVLLSVTDGFLVDTVTVSYAVTHVYDDPVLHDRMSALGASPYCWRGFGKVLWFNGSDGYLGSADTLPWSSAVVSNLTEALEVTSAWVFRVAVGGKKEYSAGLTTIPPAEHTGYVNSIRLGTVIHGDGTILPSLGAGPVPDGGAVLERGIHDIRIIWDPSAGQVRFDAAPVASWADSLSDFSGAVWSMRAAAPLLPPAWLQISLKGVDPRVYDVWSLPVGSEPSSLLSRHSAAGRAAGVLLEWAFGAPPEGDACAVLRCAQTPGDCEEIARIPLIAGATSFHWLDEEPRPGSIFTYRIYLDDGTGLELLFDTGPVTVPRAQAALFQNHPNPFNPSTTIEWYLPEAARARVCVFDVSGRIVRRLFDGRCPAGISAVEWDGRDDAGRDASAGVYFCRIISGEFEQGRKMVLLR